MTAPITAQLDAPADYRAWRTVARDLLQRHVAPERVSFGQPRATGDLFGDARCERGDDTTPATPTARIRVPRAFPELARQVLCHRDDARHALLYRLLWRLQRSPRLLDNAADADVWQAQRLAKAVRRDAHKMKAFVRFRRIEDAAGEAFIAWFEPDHHIVEYTAPFFSRRFAGMRWSIVTPERSAHWDGNALTYGDGARRSDCPDGDALEAHWRVYYASIFNPARLKVKAMRAEMPARYWKNLPESRLIPDLTRSAERAQRAAPAGSAPSVAAAQRLVAAQPPIATSRRRPADALEQIRNDVRGCTRCDLCHHATGAVPGEGPASANLMIVGEQPGDIEDLAGRPFVGPAGRVLDDALTAVGIVREDAYLTNAVKHFKFTPRGKRRIHRRPNAGEIAHCRWWLEQERAAVSPRVTLALGATAARAVLGRAVRIGEVRGTPIAGSGAETIVVTAHPASLLRLPDDEVRDARRHFVADLMVARRLLAAADNVS